MICKILFLSVFLQAFHLSTSTKDSDDYEVVFFDDFTGSSLNSSSWSIRNYSTHCSPCELQIYMDYNIEVSDGYLTLHTKKETVEGPNNEIFNYSSGWVSTDDKISYYLGKFEVHAKLPAPTATGAWPAHWLMPQSDQCWPTGGEIDIMEATYTNGIVDFSDNHVFGSYRWGTECTEDKQILPGSAFPRDNVTTESFDFANEFHTFGVEWLEDKLIFSVDGFEYETVTKDEVILPTAPMYMILDTAVAWYFPPGPNAIYPTTHVIDWVKISQKSV